MGRIVGLIPEPDKPQAQEKKQVKKPASKPVKKPTTAK